MKHPQKVAPHLQLNLAETGAIKSTGHKAQQLPELFSHQKERTYVYGFSAKRDGRLTPCLNLHGDESLSYIPV